MKKQVKIFSMFLDIRSHASFTKKSTFAKKKSVSPTLLSFNRMSSSFNTKQSMFDDLTIPSKMFPSQSLVISNADQKQNKVEIWDGTDKLQVTKTVSVLPAEPDILRAVGLCTIIHKPKCYVKKSSQSQFIGNGLTHRLPDIDFGAYAFYGQLEWDG